ncbi:MAG TPA: LysR family transcriptional regulator [Polyangiales bacterium]|nr:LysR family transcriptional regulator [Polyangiales bacterium]
MNLNHLRVFASVAEHGSLTRAARALQVSQPAISKQLGDLEQDVGALLVDRLPRGVRLTAAGEVLFAHAQRILQAERAAQTELRELAQLEAGRLSIGASTTIGSYYVPSLFGELHRVHPRVQLELRIANTEAIQEAVLANRLDLGLTEGFVASDALSVERLAVDELIAIAAPSHPLLKRAPLPARALERLPLLMREPGSGSRAVVEAALLDRGLHVIPIMSLGSTEALKNAVLHELGVAIVSRLTVEYELRTGRLAELAFSDLRIQRDLHLVTLRGKRSSPAAHAFIDLLRRRQLDDPTQRGDVYAI